MTTTTTIALIACGMVLLVQMVIIVVTSLQVSTAIKKIGTCKCNKKSNRGPVFMGPTSIPFGKAPAPKYGNKKHGKRRDKNWGVH